LASGHHTTPSIGYEQSAQKSHSLLAWAPSPRMTIATGQRQDQTTAPWDQMGGAVQGLGNDQRAHNPSIRVWEEVSGPISTLPHDQEARWLLACILK
jgi:hypothetical protein